MKKRFTEEQIIAILGEADRDGVVAVIPVDAFFHVRARPEGSPADD